MLHRCISLNDFLFKAGIVASDRCTFCYLERETIMHLFFECNKVKNFSRPANKLYCAKKYQDRHFVLQAGIYIHLTRKNILYKY